MIKLESIKTDVCPHCDCRSVVMESIDGHHVNGENFETRKFECGLKVAYVPNFSREEVKQRCKKDPAGVKEEVTIKKTKKELKEFIEASKVPLLTKISWKTSLGIYD